MSIVDGALHRVRTLLRARQYGRELADERKFHLELDAMHQTRGASGERENATTHDGVTGSEKATDGDVYMRSARESAQRRFGNTTTYSEETRAMAGLGTLDVISQDARFACRSFRRSPAFSVVAILTLGVGIGANTAIFSSMDALLFRPLPFEQPDQLMKVSLTRPATGNSPANDDGVWSWPKAAVVQTQQHVFTDIALHTDMEVTVRTRGDAERVSAEATVGKYFALLGAKPTLGRVFTSGEDSRPDGPKVVLLSTQFWKRHFNADSGVVGQDLQIGASPFMIIGVLPEGFRGLSGNAELWIPLLEDNPDALNEPWGHSYEMIARRKPDVSVAQAKAAVTALGVTVDRTYPNPSLTTMHQGAVARELDATRVDPAVRSSLFILLGAVGIVLLIACANVANLYLVRSVGRSREIAVRLAVGASRTRLVRQLLTESLVLSTAGGVAGVAIAFVGVRFLSRFDAARTLRVRNLGGLGAVRFDDIHVSATALGVALLLTIVTGLLFGLVPALHSTHPSLADALKSARSNDRNAKWGSWNSRNVLVSAEIALAFVLLAGSGLMLRTLSNLVAIAPGFELERMLTLRLNGRENTARDSMPGFYETITERLSAIPGVKGVTMQDCPPLNGGCNGTAVILRDRAPVPPGTEPSVGVHWITNNWTSITGTRLIKGRTFSSADKNGAPKVVLISETAARKIWPGEDALGKPVSVLQGGFDRDTATVVGIVSDVRYGAVDDALKPDVYLPLSQSPRTRMMVMLRTVGDPLRVVNPVRAVLHEIAPDLPPYDVRSMASRAADSTAYTKFVTFLLSAFAMVALALATLGVYGVIAFTVSHRTREIGIRMALGARVADVAGMVLGQAFIVAGAGALAGGIVALAVTRVLGSLLYHVMPNDPVTFVAIVAVLALAVVIASLVPARRAASIHPTQALREE